MRVSGRLLLQVFYSLDSQVKPGISMKELNDFVETYIVDELNAQPSNQGQYSYELVLNSLNNEVVCHGISE